MTILRNQFDPQQAPAQNEPEPLSGVKYIDVWLPLTAGVSGEDEEIRILLPSGGVVRIMLRKHFTDAPVGLSHREPPLQNSGEYSAARRICIPVSRVPFLPCVGRRA